MHATHDTTLQGSLAIKEYPWKDFLTENFEVRNYFSNFNLIYLVGCKSTKSLTFLLNGWCKPKVCIDGSKDVVHEILYVALEYVFINWISWYWLLSLSKDINKIIDSIKVVTWNIRWDVFFIWKIYYNKLCLAGSWVSQIHWCIYICNSI